MADKLLVRAGDVIDVQLTSETVVIEGADRRQVEPGHITNRMRLFVKLTDGAEQKFDFEDTELGVRETQRVVIVRGQGKGKLDRGPYNIVLFNVSSGERGEFEGGLRTFLGHTPFFGPLWKAAVISLGVALVSWFVATFVVNPGSNGGISGLWLGIMFGFLSYPAWWWLCRTWDRITERMRYRAAKKKFLAEMSARAVAYAPGSPSADQPETTQESPA
ncbi:MAG: hypothetical protein IPL62_18955 [Caulobacteraceae bacterium]|nr:hypothetical protein [Caulobacteraceae bacterium]